MGKGKLTIVCVTAGWIEFLIRAGTNLRDRGCFSVGNDDYREYRVVEGDVVYRVHRSGRNWAEDVLEATIRGVKEEKRVQLFAAQTTG